MPVVLDRLPLPNLTWYTFLSFLILTCSVYYAGVQVSLNPNWKEKLLEKSQETHRNEEMGTAAQGVQFPPHYARGEMGTAAQGVQFPPHEKLLEKSSTENQNESPTQTDQGVQFPPHHARGEMGTADQGVQFPSHYAKGEMGTADQGVQFPPHHARGEMGTADQGVQFPPHYAEDYGAREYFEGLDTAQGHKKGLVKSPRAREGLGNTLGDGQGQENDHTAAGVREEEQENDHTAAGVREEEQDSEFLPWAGSPEGAEGGKSLERKMSPYLIPEVISFMFHEPLCIWTLINMAYCVLILLGTLIQRLVFGELRVSEQQHIKDKFWNFVFYKFIFVFGVMNVQAMDEVVLWCSWFSVLGFLHLLAQLCKDRFEYLSLSATTRRRTHVRLLGLLGIILGIASFCLVICVIVGCHSGFNTFAFMVAECILLIIRTLYVITRYCIYLWDISHEGLWEKRGNYVYMTELIFELSEILMDMIHHIHMLVWGNMFLTMASLVICMQLRLLFYQLQRKIKSHKSYLRVRQLMNNYPEVQGDLVSIEERTCAICWEILSTGRCLPCSHVFHASCLLAWLHQDLSCPTCRHKLHKPHQTESVSILEGLLPTEDDHPHTDTGGEGVVGGSPSPAPHQGPGWRYVSWLPSFSVEQSHTQLARHQQASAQPAPTSQLDALARQVQQMFPDVSYLHILEDLQHTHSLEQTVDNILEHRLINPPPMFTPQGSPSMLFDLLSESQESSEEEDETQFQDAPSTPVFTTKSLDFNMDKCSSILPHIDSASQKSTESDSEGSSVDEGITSGSRFSKNPRERENILSERKATLLSQARQRFAARVQKDD